MRFFTDRKPDMKVPMRFHVDEKIGEKRALTPEGYLLCTGVPIGRTGELVYGAREMPWITPGPDRLIRVTREEADVFDERTIASFNGKPVTNDHPSDHVDKETWRSYAVGTVLNPRRGEGEEHNLLLADMLIYDASAIEDIMNGKREVSCGYDADYEELGPGHGRQHSIVGNHVALVAQGRCGPRCSIGDSKMAKRSVWDRIMTAFRANDADAMEEAVEDAKKAADAVTGGGMPALHLHLAKDEDPDEKEGVVEDSAMEERMKKVEDGIKLIADSIAKLAKDKDGDKPGEDEDEEEEFSKTDDEALDLGETWEGKASTEKPAKDRKGTQDSAHLVGNWEDAIAKAEILAPGIRTPTFDAGRAALTSSKLLCTFRRRALDHAMKADDTAEVIRGISGVSGKLTFDHMSCDAVRTLFNASAYAVGQSNTSAARGAGRVQDSNAKKVISIADVNRMNAEKFAK